jgi:hypothetical protein
MRLTDFMASVVQRQNFPSYLYKGGTLVMKAALEQQGYDNLDLNSKIALVERKIASLDARPNTIGKRDAEKYHWPRRPWTLELTVSQSRVLCPS